MREVAVPKISRGTFFPAWSKADDSYTFSAFDFIVISLSFADVITASFFISIVDVAFAIAYAPLYLTSSAGVPLLGFGIADLSWVPFIA